MKNEAQNAKELHEQRKKSYELVDEYHKKFLDGSTGKLFLHLRENRSCPVCESNEAVHIFDKSASSYFKCSSCTMVYLNPIMTTKATIDYYTNLNTGQGDVVSSDDKFYREIYTLGLDSIEHFLSRGSLLDIGCSTGFFLDLAKEKGWETSGLELGIDESAVAEKKGHKVFKSTIESLDPDKTFNVITMWDVLEHIPDGINQLNLIRDHLTDKGILFFQIPNSDSLAAKVLREDCRMFDGLEHTNLYNPLTVKKLAESCGFIVKEMRSVISEIAVLNNYLDYENPYFGLSQYNRNILNLLDANFIHSNLIGYKLQVTLEKA